jgi:hypothetical protein
MKITFTTSRAWYSGLIRWLSHGRASHVLLGVELFGREVFMHATVGGIQVTPRERFLHGNRVVAEFETKLDVPSDLLKMAAGHLGEQYDYVGLVGFIWPVMLWRWFHLKVANPLANARGMVCSEFVARIDTDGLILPEFRGLSPEETTPEDLLVICEQERSFKRLS